MNHQRRRFVDKVQYITSPGFGTGGDWRTRHGLTGGGPSHAITSMGIFAFDAVTGEMVLTSNHPGVTAEQIRLETGWPLRINQTLSETSAPTIDELAAIRKYDPKGVWTS